MNLYAESSAVLAWLLGESRGADVVRELASADLVLASDLTLIECCRVLLRARHGGEMSDLDADARAERLGRTCTHWTLLALDEDVAERAMRRFPVEPVRTLDAIHLATAVVARSLIDDVRMLSLDARVRECARALGFTVVPG